MALIEREHERERIADRLSAADAGRGSALLIEGAPGIGKTALLDVARDLAAHAGMTTLSARAGELERELAFGVVRQLLEPPLREIDPLARGDLFDGAARLAEGPLGWEGDLDQTQGMPAPGAALHGLYWLCANLADRGAMLIAVDDLHWADEPSYRFLAYLARRVAGHPLLICAASRPAATEAQGPLSAALAPGLSEVLRPLPLSLAGVERVVHHALSPDAEPEFCAACARASGGNPFLLREALQALRADDVAPVAAEAKRVKRLRPETLSGALLARLARLGPAAARVAHAVATLGSDALLRRVARLAELEPAAAALALDGLRREGILAAGRQLEFAHPLVRNAVDADLSEPARGLAHLTAARLLFEEGETPARIARHLLASEPSADPWVVETLRAAAAAALASGGPAPAASLLERALAEPPALAERAPLLVELGRARALAGRSDPAAEALEEALEHAGEPGIRAWAAIELGQVLSYDGDVEAAAATVRRALDAAEGRRELERPLQMMLLVMAETALPGREAAGDLLGNAARAVERLGEKAPRGLLALVAFERAVVTGTAADAGALAELALADGRLLAEQGPESPHTVFAAGALSLADRYEAAERALETVITDARRRGSTRAYALALATRAWSRYRRGELRGAEADAKACLELAGEAHWRLFLPQAAATLANVLVERGDLVGAAVALDEVELGKRGSGWLHAPLMRESRARLHLARGEATEALSELGACATWDADWGSDSSTWVQWRPLAALAHHVLGEPEDARRLATDGLAVARRYGAARGLGIAMRAAALIEGGERGIEGLAESASVLDRSGAELELAHSLVALGAALRRGGRRRDSREPLRAGLDRATRCGATPLAERAREELVTAGGRPRRATLSGLDSLTASELRVARLAGEGLSNPEIAQALFVTRRTVESHLTSAYRKLEIESRQDLGAALGAGSASSPRPQRAP